MSAQKGQVTAASFGAKFTSKREIYRFVASEAQIYVPAIDHVTIWHLRDLLSGKRSKILAKNVKHISVPQFEGLKIEAMLNYAWGFDEVMKAFPVSRKEQEKLP